MTVVRSRNALVLALVLGGGLLLRPSLRSQEAPQTDNGLPPEPKGVQVMARGQVHEAFASPTAPPVAPKPVPKQPPKPVNEVPPEEKPEGDVVWIPGYWTWDEERADFLWTSGVWRMPPPGKQWVSGYWREEGEQWQWVNGFWAAAAKEEGQSQDMTYLPAPPAPPAEAPPGPPPVADSFYVPGAYAWNGTAYAWRPGYYARVQPGYVWVAAHYRWTPGGYIYIPGYWDLAVSRRGFMYAPVVIDYSVVGPNYVYTPVYAVRDTVVLDSLFVRPAYGVYYFGDYYGDRYRDYGYQSSVVYSRTHYDSIVVYQTYEHRDNPTWINIQINTFDRRYRGLDPVPPRTLAQQITVVNNVNVINKTVINTTVIMPTSRLAAEKKIQVVKLDQATRTQALQRARAVQEVAQQRSRLERASGGIPTRARQAALKMPVVHPVRTAAEARTAAARSAAVTPHTTGQRTVAPQRNPIAPRTGGTNPTRPAYSPRQGATGTKSPMTTYPPRGPTSPQGQYPPRATGAPPANPNVRPTPTPPSRQPPPSSQDKKKNPPDKN